MKTPSKIVLASLIHFVVIGVFIVVIFFRVDWSIALFCLWLSISFAGFASVQNKRHKKLVETLRVNNQRLGGITRSFNQFVATINNQATALQKEMSICKECKEFPGMVRPGSIHNQADPPCVLAKGGKEEVKVPTENPQHVCATCLEEGYTDTNYKQGNCPIHN